MDAKGRLDDENRILRLWTPLILRTILATASLTLLVGLGMSASGTADYYVRRFRSIQTGQTVRQAQDWAALTTGVAHGNPHDITTLGLVVLTLVPIARVAFTFVLFVKERDPIFIGATAYVLAGLAAGILLGRIG